MNENNLLAHRPKSFEELKQINQYGAEYWSARDLQPMLGYTQWRSFDNAVSKAITSCEKSGNEQGHHFARARKPIIGGKTKKLWQEKKQEPLMNDKTDISGSDKDLFAGKARVRLLDDNVPFYPAPESKTAPIKRLKKGDNFYLVGKEAHGMSEIVLLDSHIGFVENKVRILYLDRFDCWYKRTDFLSSNTVEMLMYGIFNLEYWTSPFKHAIVILDKDKLVINDFWKSVTLDTIPIKEISEIYSGRFGQALRLRIVTIRSLLFGGLAAIGSILLLAFNGVGGGVAVVGAISIGLGLAFLVFIFSFLHTFGKLGRKPIKLDFLTVEGRRVSVVISQRSKQCEHAADVLQTNGLIVTGAPRV